MNKLVEVNLWKKETDACNKCGNKKSTTKDCCKTKQEQIKVDKNQQAAKNIYKAGEIQAIQLFYSPAEYRSLAVSTRVADHPESNAPPLSRQVATYLLNCTFRI
jgi:hypothetical protein